MTITALDRRRFLALAGIAAGGAFAPAFTRSAFGATTLTGVTYLPPSYKALSFGSEGFVERLKKAAPEETTVEFFDSGTLLAADEQLPALRAGQIQFMFHTSSYITRSLPILGITGLPGIAETLYENPDRLAMGSPLFELMNEELASDDLYMLSLGGGLLQPEYIWSTEDSPIRSIADIEGKKVRVVSYEATKVIENFGAAAVRIPSSEIYLAMQRGTVDAAVANISTIIGRSVQEETAVLYELPLTAYGIGVFVSRRRWDNEFPDEVKEAMMSSARWFDEHSAKEANEVIYPGDYRDALESAGVETVDPSEEDLDRLAEAAEGVIEEWREEVGEEVGTRAIALANGESAG